MMMIMNAQVILAYIFLQKNLKREESMIHTLDTVTYFLIKLGMKLYASSGKKHFFTK